MSGRIWPYQCRGCNAELATVDDGQLFPLPTVPVRVARDGTVWLRCTAMLDGGRLCNRERGWHPARGRSTAA